eukprot:1175860-Prorocentrum_minimum.AAC.2
MRSLACRRRSRSRAGPRRVLHLCRTDSRGARYTYVTPVEDVRVLEQALVLHLCHTDSRYALHLCHTCKRHSRSRAGARWRRAGTAPPAAPVKVGGKPNSSVVKGLIKGLMAASSPTYGGCGWACARP